MRSYFYNLNLLSGPPNYRDRRLAGISVNVEDEVPLG